MYLIAWLVAFVEEVELKGFVLMFGLGLLFVMLMTSKCPKEEEKVFCEEEDIDEVI